MILKDMPVEQKVFEGIIRKIFDFECKTRLKVLKDKYIGFKTSVPCQK